MPGAFNTVMLNSCQPRATETSRCPLSDWPVVVEVAQPISKVPHVNPVSLRSVLHSEAGPYSFSYGIHEFYTTAQMNHLCLFLRYDINIWPRLAPRTCHRVSFEKISILLVIRLRTIRQSASRKGFSQRKGSVNAPM